MTPLLRTKIGKIDNWWITQWHNYIISVLHSEDLFSQVLEVIEGGLRGDGVDEDEALPVLHVEVPHSSELFLYSAWLVLVECLVSARLVPG